MQPVSVPAGFTVQSNIPANTALASGAETTFTVRMTAAAADTSSGEVSFANTDGDENPFNITISGTAAATRIIDNGDEGFSTVGTWHPFTGQGLNNDVQYAAGGGGSQIASWSFPVAAGQYQVAVTWTTHANRATNAPYTVSQGAATLFSGTVNQEQAPSDFTDAGVEWRILGTVTALGRHAGGAALGQRQRVRDCRRRAAGADSRSACAGNDATVGRINRAGGSCCAGHDHEKPGCDEQQFNGTPCRLGVHAEPLCQ